MIDSDYNAQHEALYHAAQVSDAALGAAEELGWPLGMLAGLCVYLYWGTILGGIVAAVVVYFVARYKYNKAHEAAWKAYKLATGALG